VSFYNSTSILNRLRLTLVFGLVLILIAGCANNPIDTGNPIAFKHRTGVFELQVPKSWKQAQDQVATESLAAFSDPSGNSELIGYAGLMEHALSKDEGVQAVSGLVKNLLNAPSDLAITNGQQRPDGAFTASLSFTRNNVKRSGQAIFRAGSLALSGMIVSGPAADWSTLATALQPYIDSFKLNPDFVQGTYFTPIEDTHYALVIPADATHQKTESGQQVKSRSGDLTIALAQQPLPAPLDAQSLPGAAIQRARQVLGTLTAVSNEPLPDGRLKLTLDQGTKHIIGYVEQKDAMLITVFFAVPAAQAEAYQPLIDFMYSTLVTGKS
jgi:hypothetical protein